MSFPRLHRNPQSAFSSHANSTSGVAVKPAAAALLERFLAHGSPLDVYALAGLWTGIAGRQSEAYEAVERFVQSVTAFVPDGDSVAPGELAYDTHVAQSSPAADTQVRVPIGQDLSTEVTVFVTTIGYPTFERCMECLRAQDCSFRLKVIANIAPMSAAFQRMLDECETPFYVQVDEDMLLYPQAVRTLYERMRRLDNTAAMFVACLFDEHMDRAIYGLKIFRAEIVRRYPVRDVEGFEWEQQSRWRRDGYMELREPVAQADPNPPRTLGLHGTHWTPLAIYIRYFVLERTRRMGNKSHQWVSTEALKLLDRFLEKRADVDLYALGGILAGRLQDRLSTGRSKDADRYQQTPGFEDFRRFVEVL